MFGVTKMQLDPFRNKLFISGISAQNRKSELKIIDVETANFAEPRQKMDHEEDCTCSTENLLNRFSGTKDVRTCNYPDIKYLNFIRMIRMYPNNIRVFA